MRGENWARLLFIGMWNGSPPRAWGEPAAALQGDSVDRITPTCVGRTSARARAARCAPDHPHVRGENASMSSISRITSGSPPRAWGERQLRLAAVDAFRITPTCVGRTGFARSLPDLPTDHPHVRGENRTGLTVSSLTAGSPPRAWGERRRQRLARREDRITPHVRGENVKTLRMKSQVAGSPPRAWGERQQRRSRPVLARITPTCVGRTAWKKMR